MSDVRITLNMASASTLINNLRRKNQSVKESVNSEMEQLVMRLFEEAQQKVPTATGALASSGNVSMQNSGDVYQRTIGYGTSVTNPVTGKATSSYAVDKHEQYNPQKPESYKWLEKTLLSNTDTFLQCMANAVASGLSK